MIREGFKEDVEIKRSLRDGFREADSARAGVSGGIGIDV